MEIMGNNVYDFLSQFQCREAYESQYAGDYPESYYYLRLGPSKPFKMMMYGCAEEDPFLEEPEADHLYDHRHRLHHENSTHYHQQQLLLYKNRYEPYGTSQRKTAGVAHEH